MNCMAKCFSWVLNVPIKDIYSGIGHIEPIHMDEAVAYFLTQGFALVPRDIPNIPVTGYMFLEGVTAQREPHMIALKVTKFLDPSCAMMHERMLQYDEYCNPGDIDLVSVDIYWYMLPCHKNIKFNELHAKARTDWVSAIERTWGIS